MTSINYHMSLFGNFGNIKLNFSVSVVVLYEIVTVLFYIAVRVYEQ